MGMMAGERDWQAECDMRTLEQIKQDPSRVTAAKQYAEKQAKALQKFAAKPGPKKPAGF